MTTETKLFIVLGVALLAAAASFGVYEYTKTHKTSPNADVGEPAWVTNSTVDRIQAFRQWATENGKIYGGDQQQRFAIWSENVDTIDAHNAKNLSWTLGLNQFADLTTEEFSAMYLGRSSAKGPKGRKVNHTTDGLPASIDWREKGALTPVKNQAQCGSCYTFSATGALEALSFIATGKLGNFSEQQIVDCSQKYGNEGCNGGLPEQVFQYVADFGIMTEGDYPYIAVDEPCRGPAAGKNANLFKNKAFVDVKVNDTDALKAAVAERPVSIGVEADKDIFHLYKEGVVSDFEACGTDLDHAIVIVGYGTDEKTGQDYWIVRNSWGPAWGEAGHIRIARGNQGPNGEGVCGINMDASYPTL